MLIDVNLRRISLGFHACNRMCISSGQYLPFPRHQHPSCYYGVRREREWGKRTTFSFVNERRKEERTGFKAEQEGSKEEKGRQTDGIEERGPEEMAKEETVGGTVEPDGAHYLQDFFTPSLTRGVPKQAVLQATSSQEPIAIGNGNDQHDYDPFEFILSSNESPDASDSALPAETALSLPNETDSDNPHREAPSGPETEVHSIDAESVPDDPVVIAMKAPETLKPDVCDGPLPGQASHADHVVDARPYKETTSTDPPSSLPFQVGRKTRRASEISRQLECEQQGTISKITDRAVESRETENSGSARKAQQTAHSSATKLVLALLNKHFRKKKWPTVQDGILGLNHMISRKEGYCATVLEEFKDSLKIAKRGDHGRVAKLYRERLSETQNSLPRLKTALELLEQEAADGLALQSWEQLRQRLTQRSARSPTRREKLQVEAADHGRVMTLAHSSGSHDDAATSGKSVVNGGSKNASDFSLSTLHPLYLPYSVQNQLLRNVLDSMKRALFVFGMSRFPRVMEAQCWHWAAAINVIAYTRMFRLSARNDIANGRSTDVLSCLPKKTKHELLDIFLPLQGEMRSLQLLRNAYAHERQSLDTSMIKDALIDMKTLAHALHALKLRRRLDFYHEWILGYESRYQAQKKEHVEGALRELDQIASEKKMGEDRFQREKAKLEERFAVESRKLADKIESQRRALQARGNRVVERYERQDRLTRDELAASLTSSLTPSGLGLDEFIKLAESLGMSFSTSEPSAVDTKPTSSGGCGNSKPAEAVPQTSAQFQTRVDGGTDVGGNECDPIGESDAHPDDTRAATELDTFSAIDARKSSCRRLTEDTAGGMRRRRPWVRQRRGRFSSRYSPLANAAATSRPETPTQKNASNKHDGAAFSNSNAPVSDDALPATRSTSGPRPTEARRRHMIARSALSSPGYTSRPARPSRPSVCDHSVRPIQRNRCAPAAHPYRTRRTSPATDTRTPIRYYNSVRVKFRRGMANPRPRQVRSNKCRGKT
ncbi:hypothetical protein BU26DRAFT_515301 [Trematosphaeria pertusa]|uniref:Uncharacterized protein n=1 Tax=Trematosphaeria pertusa TaxID=390896 RepID=A0A6A6IR74_9PLEO|nr:uncharacterized protein BU26DRAFT_515301 [Trematosphaeria pertusa]KAF2252876.1 hypothetical protein BU26DRAFT_515301 [Trematosphaeria pertusa]